jgi:hypothetical protein
MPSSTKSASLQTNKKQTTSFQIDVPKKYNQMMFPYKYGIPENHIPQGHLVEHVACILHAPTFC